MTEPKIDCADFVLVEIGDKKKCGHYIQGGGCMLPSHAQCTVVSKEISLPSVLSHTSISAFRNCRRYFWLYYIKKVRPIITQSYFIEGRVLHLLMKNIYSGDFSDDYKTICAMFEQEQSKDPKVDTVYAIALMTQYIIHLNDTPLLNFRNLDLEQIVDTQLYGCPVRAIYDGLATDKSYFVEHKFTGIKSLEQVQKIHHSSQISFYFLLEPKAEKCVLNLVKKVGLKFNPVKEKLQEFLNRAIADIKENPNKYFRQVVYGRDEFDLQDEGEGIRTAMLDIASMNLDMYSFYKNTRACSIMNCIFSPVCETGVISEQFYKILPAPTQGPHLELLDIEEA